MYVCMYVCLITFYVSLPYHRSLLYHVYIYVCGDDYDDHQQANEREYPED